MNLSKVILEDLMERCIQIQHGKIVLEQREHVSIRDIFLKSAFLPNSGKTGLDLGKLQIYLAILEPPLVHPCESLKSATTPEDYLKALTGCVERFSDSVYACLDLLKQVRKMLRANSPVFIKSFKLEDDFHNLDSHARNLMAMRQIEIQERKELVEWAASIKPADLLTV